jgi:chaperonin GroES
VLSALGDIPAYRRPYKPQVTDQLRRRHGPCRPLPRSSFIPDTAKEKPQEAKVIAVGNGKVTDEGKKLPLDVKAGDRILFGKYSGSEVKIDGEEYLILREEDVLGILD